LKVYSNHGDIGYFEYVVSPYGYYTCGVISQFEYNFIVEATLWNKKYVP